MNDSRDFRDAESARNGLSHVPSQPVFFPPYRDPGGMLSRSVGMRSSKEGPPSIWDTHGISGNVFAGSVVSSSSPYSQGFNPWISTVSECQNPDTTLDPRCQSGPSARNSFIFNGRDSSNNNGADQQRLQISDLHFDKVTTSATFACWKKRFKTEVCTGSQFSHGSYALDQRSGAG